MKTSAPLPEPETLTAALCAEWEPGPTWRMIWDHYRSSSPATLLAWLDKGEMVLRQNLAVKAMELDRAWTRLGASYGMGPEYLAEAFQTLYPASSETEPAPLSAENAERLEWFLDLLTFTPEELRAIFAPEPPPSWLLPT